MASLGDDLNYLAVLILNRREWFNTKPAQSFKPESPDLDIDTRVYIQIPVFDIFVNELFKAVYKREHYLQSLKIIF